MAVECYARFGLIDREGEQTSVEFRMNDIADDGTDFNQRVVGPTSDVGLLQSAIDATSLLHIQSVNVRLVGGVGGNKQTGLPTDDDAQREWPFRLALQDQSSGKKYTKSIGGVTAALKAARGSQSENIDVAQADLAALITAIETYTLGPDGGTPSVLKAYTTGRHG